MIIFVSCCTGVTEVWDLAGRSTRLGSDPPCRAACHLQPEPGLGEGAPQTLASSHATSPRGTESDAVDNQPKKKEKEKKREGGERTGRDKT